MAYTKTNWLSRLGTNLNKFTKSQETSTSVVLTNAPDAVSQAGTPFSAENMNKMEQGIYDAHQGISGLSDTLTAHADMVDGAGRNLLDVLNVGSIPAAMAALRTRCNGTGTPNFRGLLIGDYLDGLDLSGVEAAPGGTAPMAWNDTHKNNRIVIAGFNTFNLRGDSNKKNHIVFIFRNIICTGRMKEGDDNTGGYLATEMRAWLEGQNGDGSGPFATRLKAALGGDYLYTISILGDSLIRLTLRPPSDIEILGFKIEEAKSNKYFESVQLPIYQRSSVYQVKFFNGVLYPSVMINPWKEASHGFCIIGYNGIYSHTGYVNNPIYGISPIFCMS